MNFYSNAVSEINNILLKWNVWLCRPPPWRLQVLGYCGLDVLYCYHNIVGWIGIGFVIIWFLIIGVVII